MQAVALVILVFVLLCNAQTAIVNPPRTFQASGTWAKLNQTFNVDLHYSFNTSQMAVFYSFYGGSTMKELFQYDTKQLYQTCSFGSCQNMVSYQGMYQFFPSGNICAF